VMWINQSADSMVM